MQTTPVGVIFRSKMEWLGAVEVCYWMEFFNTPAGVFFPSSCFFDLVHRQKQNKMVHAFKGIRRQRATGEKGKGAGQKKSAT